MGDDDTINGAKLMKVYLSFWLIKASFSPLLITALQILRLRRNYGE